MPLQRVYFLSSHERAGSYRKTLVMLQDPKKGQKDRIFIEDKPNHVRSRTHGCDVIAVKQNLIDDFSISK